MGPRTAPVLKDSLGPTHTAAVSRRTRLTLVTDETIHAQWVMVCLKSSSGCLVVGTGLVKVVSWMSGCGRWFV
jgi:hypothetical protein